MPGRDLLGPEESHRRATRQVVPSADERHPVVIWRNAGVGRGGQHGELAAISIRLPQAGHRKQRFAGLDEADAFFKKSVGDNQAVVLHVRLKREQLGDGFALGIDERLFVSRHEPTRPCPASGGDTPTRWGWG